MLTVKERYYIMYLERKIFKIVIINIIIIFGRTRRVSKKVILKPLTFLTPRT